jgi:hypothetical protein
MQAYACTALIDIWNSPASSAPPKGALETHRKRILVECKMQVASGAVCCGFEHIWEGAWHAWQVRAMFQLAYF